MTYLPLVLLFVITAVMLQFHLIEICDRLRTICIFLRNAEKNGFVMVLKDERKGGEGK